MAKISKGDRLQQIRKSSGAKRDQAIKEALREGIDMTRISQATGRPREEEIKHWAEGWR